MPNQNKSTRAVKQYWVVIGFFRIDLLAPISIVASMIVSN